MPIRGCISSPRAAYGRYSRHGAARVEPGLRRALERARRAHGGAGARPRRGAARRRGRDRQEPAARRARGTGAGRRRARPPGAVREPRGGGDPAAAGGRRAPRLRDSSSRATGPRPATSAQLVGGPIARLHALVLDRLERAAAASPVLLVLEDLQWADRSTLDLVAFLARRLRASASSSSRPIAATRSPPPGLQRLLADAAAAPTAQRLELAGLTRPRCGSRSGDPRRRPPADLLDGVFARSEGNPFFAEELVAAGRAVGDGSPDAARHPAGPDRRAGRRRAGRGPRRGGGRPARCTTGCSRRPPGCPSRSSPRRCARRSATTY